MYKNNNVEFHEINYVNDDIFELPDQMIPVIRQNNFKLYANYEKHLKTILVERALSQHKINEIIKLFFHSPMKYKPAMINDNSVGFHCSFDCNFVYNENIKKLSGYINVSTWVKIPHNLRDGALTRMYRKKSAQQTRIDLMNEFFHMEKCFQTSRKLVYHPNIPNNKRVSENIITNWKKTTQF